MRDIHYIASTQKDLLKLPPEVQQKFAFAIAVAASGEEHPDAKALTGFNGRNILEVIGNNKGNTYRAIYTVRYKEAIYVIHVFQKKSKTGKETPKQEMDLIKKRLKYIEEIHKEMYEKKTKK